MVDVDLRAPTSQHGNGGQKLSKSDLASYGNLHKLRHPFLVQIIDAPRFGTLSSYSELTYSQTRNADMARYHGFSPVTLGDISEKPSDVVHVLISRDG